MSWITVALSVLGLLLAGGGVGGLVTALAKRRTIQVDAIDKFSDANLKWVQEFQQDAQAARADTAAMRRELMELRSELDAIRREAEALAEKLRRFRWAVLDPNTDLEHLRNLVANEK